MNQPIRNLVIGGVLLACLTGRLCALDPKTHISQYGHSAWRVQDGVLNSGPTVIAQTKDGYVWIGTETGLLRFDGERFVQWTAPGWDQLANREINTLFAASDGTLWIATPTQLASLKDNKLTIVPVLGGGHVNEMVEDPKGRIWFTASRVKGKPLCQVENYVIRCFGESDGVPFLYGEALALDSDGSLIVSSTDEVVRWSPERGRVSLYTFGDLKRPEGLYGIDAVDVDSDGAILVGMGFAGRGLGLQRIKDGVVSRYDAPGLDGSSLQPQTLKVDRSGALWIGTASSGLYRVAGSVVDHFTTTEGLSGDSIRDVQEDQEGNLWVTTDGGVDCFHDLKVISWTSHEGLPSGFVSSVLAARDGSVLIGISDVLNILKDGHNAFIGKLQGLPGSIVTAMLQDQAGRYWIGIDNQLAVYDGHKFLLVTEADGKPIGVVICLAEDANGGIWASRLGPHRGLVHIENDKVDASVPIADIQGQILSDGHSGVWLIGGSGAGHYLNGQVQWFPLGSASRSGPKVRFKYLAAAVDGSIMVGSADGLWELRDSKSQMMSPANGLPCQGIISMSFSDEQVLVLKTPCGLVEIAPEALSAWWSKPGMTVPMKLIDRFDGAHPSSATFSPQMSKSSDGKIWIANEAGIQVFDPDHVPVNSVPPPVHIEEVIADRSRFDTPVAGLALAPLTRDIEIHYTALSFSLPQKVRFRYMLEGLDTAWQEPGNRRTAFYQNLKPRRYRFRVIAANNDGVWNEVGDSWEFSVRPAWFQTVWFRVLWITCAFVFLWAIYRARVRYIAKAISRRFDDRLAERTRVARQLHDTLLQTVQGSKMIADDALDPSADEARRIGALVKLSRWLEQATREGREALHSLRVSTIETNHLSESLRRAAESVPGFECKSIEVNTSGDPRDIHPIVRDEIFQIAFEALRNAIQHSQAKSIQVEIAYAREFLLTIKDDGIGLDPSVALSGRSGHFGLVGMRERASRIRGKLKIAGGSNGGTEITLAVPGAIAYRKDRALDL